MMPGQYDAVMSTGFFERVGSDFWVEHFRKVKQYLKPGGVCMIQTMLTNKFDRKEARTLNFNTKYIFPGGEFPSIGSFIVAAEEAGLKCEEHPAFGQDYARTMAECWKNFHNNVAGVRALGFDTHSQVGIFPRRLVRDVQVGKLQRHASQARSLPVRSGARC